MSFFCVAVCLLSMKSVGRDGVLLWSMYCGSRRGIVESVIKKTHKASADRGRAP